MDIKEILSSKMSDRTKVELLSFMLEKAAPQEPAPAEEPKAVETLETPLTQQEQRQQGAENTLLELMGMLNAKHSAPVTSTALEAVAPGAPTALEAAAPGAPSALEAAAEKMSKAADVISQQIGFMAGYDSGAKTPIEEGREAIAQLMLADNFKI